MKRIAEGINRRKKNLLGNNRWVPQISKENLITGVPTTVSLIPKDLKIDVAMVSIFRGRRMLVGVKLLSFGVWVQIIWDPARKTQPTRLR